MRILILFVVISAGVLFASDSHSARRPDTELYESVLQKYVQSDGKVKYTELKSDIAPLDKFVAEIAAVSPDSNPELFPSREEKLAYWLNAYNALVLDTFAHEYPGKREQLSTEAGRQTFFYKDKHKVGGKNRTLDDIERNTIRRFGDPRIHFAIVCASASCPYLARTAYRGDTLDRRLDEEARRYWSQSRNFTMDEAHGEITVPAILDWFKEDFGGDTQHVTAFLAKYRPKEAQMLTSRTWQIKYFPYDWSPNDVK